MGIMLKIYVFDGLARKTRKQEKIGFGSFRLPFEARNYIFREFEDTLKLKQPFFSPPRCLSFQELSELGSRE